ncbi:MAG: AAA family ATPase [Nitrospinota bacterium]|nr:AAA family ATPase [Nitrospinota bacterium]
METTLHQEVHAQACRLLRKKINSGFKLVALHEYQDSSGAPQYWVARLESEQGDKYIRPIYKNGSWRLARPSFPDGTLLYRLPAIITSSPTEPVWVFEGDKCADAAANLGLVATTSGSSTSARQADWTPLKGRQVIVWPDNDTPGEKYAEDVIKLLEGLGCQVCLIALEGMDLPESGDIVDWLRDNPGATRADVEALPRVEPSRPMDLSKAMLSYDGLLKAHLPDRPRIFPWLPEGALAMVSARRGLGKTWFSLGLAHSVTTGSPFMKWPGPETRGVLFLDGEMPLSTLRERVTAFPGQPKAPFAILSHEYFWHHFEKDLDIADAQIQAAILYELNRAPAIRLLVVDNLSALARIQEDKSDAWRSEVLPFLLALRRRGVAVLLVHHTGKSGDQRGTGAREDALDTSIVLAPANGPKPDNDGAAFEVRFTKSRGAFGPDVAPFIARLKKGADGALVWACQDISESVADRLLALVAECGVDGITAVDAATELQVSRGAISKAKARLIDSGSILVTGSGRGALLKLAREI